MKRTFLFSALLITMCTFCLTNVSAKSTLSDGQGIAYYRAGFPIVAKPLLISEIEASTSTRAEACFNLGNIYFLDNQLDSAAITFNKGIEANPMYSLNAVGITMLKIKSDPVAAELNFTSLLKMKINKKNVDVYIAIANAYLFNGVIDKAIFYQEKARSIKSKYAQVYVVLGDIELAKKNSGEACRNYEQAIYFDKNCKEAYIKYARAYKTVNPTLAIEKLNELKVIDPAFLLVDKELADIYYAINDFTKAAELYANYLQSGNSNIKDLTQYALTLFLKGDFSKSLEVVNLGLEKSPRNPVFNRLALYNNVDLTTKFNSEKKSAEALAANQNALSAANAFFNKTDNPEFSCYDYVYYGKAYRDNNQIDLAIPQYEKALQVDSTKGDLWRDVSEMYNKRTDYTKSLIAYTNYMKSLPEDKKTPDVSMSLGRIYYGIGTKNDSLISIETKKQALLKADSIFGDVAVKEPTIYRGNLWRARTNSAIDSETTLGLAKPYYDLTVTLLEAKADARYNDFLLESYAYLGYFYYLKSDFAASIACQNKILLVDPKNTKAKRSIEEITKEMNKKKK